MPRSTFYKWHRILVENKRNTVKNKFIPIRVKECEEERSEEIKSEMIIESKKGIRIGFNKGCKIEEIKAIVEILVLSHLLKSIRIFDILKEMIDVNNAESRPKINEVFQES